MPDFPDDQRFAYDAALHRSQALLQLVLDNVPAQIAYYDNATVLCVFANQAYLKANGKTLEWAIGKHCRDIIGPAAWAAIEPQVERVRGGANISYERMLTLPSGEEKRIEVNLLPHTSGSGVQIGVFVLIHDITRHYLAEKAVRDNEERLRKFAAATSELIVFHKDGVVEDCNEALASLLGVPRSEIPGRNLLDFLPPSQRAIAQMQISQGIECTYQTSVMAAGREVPVEATVKNLHFNGQELRLVAARDVSQRNALMLSLAKSQTQYQALVDNSHEAVLVAQGGILQFANATASRMFGLPAEQLVGRPSIELVHPDDRNMVISKRRQMMNGQLLEPYAARMIAPPAAEPGLGSQVRWSQIYGARIDWNEAPALLILIADISEQVRLRERLALELRQREAILSTTAVGVCMLRHRTYEWVNTTMCQMLGYEAAEMVGQTTRMHHISDESWKRAGQLTYARIAQYGSFSGETKIWHKDGRQMWVQMDGRALGDGSAAEYSVWTCVDITQRKLAELEMQQALQKERELGELKTRFVSMASHEFRTPLSTIQTAADLLLHYADRLTPQERQTSLTDIQQAVERMRVQMENFLSFGRMESHAVCKRAACDVQGLLAQLVAETDSADLQRHRIVLQVVSPMPSGAAPSLMLDAALLRQIVSNLLGNACKYSAPGSEVRLRWGEIEGALQIEITDQGIGIPDADLPHLFEAFHRAANAGGVQGTGLGLAIVQRAVQTHGGDIEVQSTLGQGTRFCLRLPWHVAGAVAPDDAELNHG